MQTSEQPEPTRLERLWVDLRALELAIANCESNRDLPPLIREHRAVMAEIDLLQPSAVEVDEIDEIAARRASRGSGAATG